MDSGLGAAPTSSVRATFMSGSGLTHRQRKRMLLPDVKVGKGGRLRGHCPKCLAENYLRRDDVTDRRTANGTYAICPDCGNRWRLMPRDIGRRAEVPDEYVKAYIERRMSCSQIADALGISNPTIVASCLRRRGIEVDSKGPRTTEAYLRVTAIGTQNLRAYHARRHAESVARYREAVRLRIEHPEWDRHRLAREAGYKNHESLRTAIKTHSRASGPVWPGGWARPGASFKVAMRLRVEHPNWSQQQIADEAGYASEESLRKAISYHKAKRGIEWPA